MATIATTTTAAIGSVRSIPAAVEVVVVVLDGRVPEVEEVPVVVTGIGVPFCHQSLSANMVTGPNGFVGMPTHSVR